MNTCGTCKFFGKPVVREYWNDDDTETIVARLHACDLLKHLNEPGWDEQRKLFECEPAGVIDGSGYHATFCVSEEFGCNQWQPPVSSGSVE